MAVVLIWGCLGAAPRTWELRGDQWPEVSQEGGQAATTRPVSEPTLDQVQRLLDQGRQGAARGLCVKWLKTHRRSPVRDRALYLMAEGYYQHGDRIRAFYYCDELMDGYPDSPYFNAALRKQFQIADAYLDGYKRRFLWIPMFSGADEAIEMMYRIQQRSPGSPLAEQALLRTADYYFADSQFDLAADAYAAYQRAYPRSPYVPRTRLRQAFSSYAQFRGLNFDATPIIDSRAQLADIVNEYPELAEQENIPAFVARIDRAFAQKLYRTGDFYRRTSEPRAAVYTYRFLINTYPDSPEATRAKDQLNRMPAWALAEPEPAAGEGYAPTTMPAGRGM